MALGLLAAMVEAEVGPDTISYTAAVSACEKGARKFYGSSRTIQHSLVRALVV